MNLEQDTKSNELKMGEMASQIGIDKLKQTKLKDLTKFNQKLKTKNKLWQYTSKTFDLQPSDSVITQINKMLVKSLELPFKLTIFLIVAWITRLILYLPQSLKFLFGKILPKKK